MHIVFTPSPSVAHKYRVVLPDKRAIDFGDKSVRHYIDHGNPVVMRKHLIERGAILPDKLQIEFEPIEIHRQMLTVDKSSKEDWENFYTREYWDRWLLWSYPTVEKAKLFMTMNHGMLFMPVPEDFWYVKHL